MAQQAKITFFGKCFIWKQDSKDRGVAPGTAGMARDIPKVLIKNKIKQGTILIKTSSNIAGCPSCCTNSDLGAMPVKI